MAVTVVYYRATLCTFFTIPSGNPVCFYGVIFRAPITIVLGFGKEAQTDTLHLEFIQKP
jgi:hypothetical protein